MTTAFSGCTDGAADTTGAATSAAGAGELEAFEPRALNIL